MAIAITISAQYTKLMNAQTDEFAIDEPCYSNVHKEMVLGLPGIDSR